MDDWEKKLKLMRGIVRAIGAARGARALRGVSIDELLERIGLERRRSAADRAASFFGGFGAGFVAGGAVGLLFAPMKGEELRALLRSELAKRKEAWFGSGEQHVDERPGGFDAPGDEGHPGPRV